MPHDPLVLALMVAVLALQVSFKLLDTRAKKKANGSAGQMSREAWIVIFNELFEHNLKPFQERHDKLVDRLEKMADGFQANRQLLIDKLDRLTDAVHEEAKTTRHDLRNAIHESIVIVKGRK